MKHTAFSLCLCTQTEAHIFEDNIICVITDSQSRHRDNFKKYMPREKFEAKEIRRMREKSLPSVLMLIEKFLASLSMSQY